MQGDFIPRFSITALTRIHRKIPAGMAVGQCGICVPMPANTIFCPIILRLVALFDDPRTITGFAGALANFGIPFALHLFHSGNHGGGLYDGQYEVEDNPHTAKWAELACDWLEDLGFLGGK